MAIQQQIRRAATGTQVARTLTSGELDFDTTLGRLNVHNGSTAGGIKHPNYADIQKQTFSYTSVSGTNALTATLAPALTVYTAGQSIEFQAVATNTGAVTINVNSLGAKNVYKKDTLTGTLVSLVAGDIINTGVYRITYDGTQYQLIGAGGSSSSSVFELISVVSTNGVGSVSIDIPSDYTSIKCVISGVRSSDTARNLAVRLRRSGGAYDSGFNYAAHMVRVSGTTVSGQNNVTSQAEITAISSSNSEGFFGELLLTDLQSANTYKGGSFVIYNPTSGISASNDVFSGGMTYGSAGNTIDGIQFFPTGGSFNQGEIKVYGMKDS